MLCLRKEYESLEELQWFAIGIYSGATQLVEQFQTSSALTGLH